MGMFDYVLAVNPCRKCGAPLTDWQSKDGPCILAVLTPDDVSNYYTACPDPACGAWNEYTRERTAPFREHGGNDD